MLINPYVFAAAGGGGSDPSFAQVVFLMHADGSDEGTTFTDSSQYARTINKNGSPVTDTAQFKFGTTSLRLDADGSSRVDYVSSTGAAPETKIVSVDWTLEFWFYALNGAAMTAFKNAFTSVYPVKISVQTGAAIGVEGAQGDGTGAFALTGLGNIPTGQWVHVAIVRHGSTFYLFQDGVQQDTDTYSGDLGENNANFRIGPNSGATMWIDDWRFTVGTARYTSGFTPPTQAFPDA
jgi:hypothetical protein